jgi:hypothetical protein
MTGLPPAAPPGGYGVGLPPGVRPDLGAGPGGGPPHGQNEPYAVASLAVGLASLVLGGCCGLLAIPGAIVAIALGCVSLSRAKSQPGGQRGSGMAWAGIAIGGVSLLLYVALFALGVGANLLMMLFSGAP